MATFYNQATLSYRGGSVSSNVTVGEIVSALSVSKTALTGTYVPGGELGYIVTIVNTGSSPVSNLTVTDDLGEYAFGEGSLVPLEYEAGSIKYFVDGVLQSAPAVTQTSPLTVSGIDVPANGTSMLVYAARVNSFAPPAPGGEITNTAAITGAGIAELTASETVSAAGEAVLEIAKSVSPAVVNENGEISYTFVITNEGGADASAEDEIVLADTFSPVLHNIAVSMGGEAMEKSVDYTYDEASGEFSTVPGAITVPAAAFTQNPDTGEWTAQPGSVTLTITGNI